MSDEVIVRLAVAETKLGHVTEKMDEMAASLKTIESKMDQVKGGWIALSIASAIAGTFGAALMKFLPFFANSPR